MKQEQEQVRSEVGQRSLSSSGRLFYVVLDRTGTLAAAADDLGLNISRVRMTHGGETRQYVEKRRAEGRTDKGIRACIKRYLARRLYRTLREER